MPWTYPPEFVEALASHGLAPRPDSPPSRVRDFVDALYKIELRRLRARLKAGDVVKADYADAVVALRRKYWLLTLQPHAWERICGADPDAGWGLARARTARLTPQTTRSED